MKKLTIFVILSFQALTMFSQSISVELSVTWEKGYDIFKKDSMVSVPKLQITYRNISNTNYYFSKISDSRDGLPMMPWGGSIHPGDLQEYLLWRDDYYRRAKTHLNYVNEHFHVRIGGWPSFSPGWEAIPDSLKYVNEREIAIINDNLADIYEYMFHSNSIEYEEKKIYFSPSDIAPENILCVVKNQFVFLKPDEIYVDTYNLIGFKIVEGCFSFAINQSAFRDYVLVQPTWKNDKSYWLEQTAKLPVKVGEYHLYSGSFFTNTVTVNFTKY